MNIDDITLFKRKALTYGAKFEACCYLDSNGYNDKYGKIDCLIAFGIERKIEREVGQAFADLKSFVNDSPDWMFGLLGYDLKNETEALNPAKSDLLNFPDLYFFVPKNLIAISGNTVQIIKGTDDLLQKINSVDLSTKTSSSAVFVNAKLSEAEYIAAVKTLQQHITRGDIYEVNFCQEFFAKNAKVNPIEIYEKLQVLSPTPFSGFLKIENRYILSATPERFLSRKGDILISQPIKGTAKRSKDLTEDANIRTALKANEKERAENVMIVDLVRNDLTKSAVKGTVAVEELFGIYTFPQVHQMISTITCRLNPEVHFIDAIKNTFPMGSMTGAPKLRAMQLIDQYEKSKRGAYSGSLGYIMPNGDFDFNVIIRSILYNGDAEYLSFQVGGAITYNSIPEKEYEECLLKASAILEVLKATNKKID